MRTAFHKLVSTRSVTALVLVLFVVAELHVVSHHALVSHSYCAEHDELEHHSRAGHGHHDHDHGDGHDEALQDGPAPEGLHVKQGPQDDEHGDRCDLCRLHESRVVSENAPLCRSAKRIAPATSVLAVLATRLAVHRYAPKQSPPAVAIRGSV